MNIKSKIAHSLPYALTVGMLCIGICGCGGSKDPDAAQGNKLVVKGLSVGMSGDDAVEACKKIVGEATDIAVLDFRNGIVREKDAATIAKEKKSFETAVLKAKWNAHLAKREELLLSGKSNDEVNKMGYKVCSFDEFVEKNPGLDPYELLNDPSIKEALAKQGKNPPSATVTLPKKNVISIRLRNNKRTEDEWKTLCSVWIDNSGNVKEVYFTEAGLNRLFNAKNISTTELADLLVKNYKGIPSLNKTVRTESETRDGSVAMKTFTWIYKGKDYQVKLLECDFFDQNDRKFDIHPDLGLAMVSQANKQCDKYLAITAVDPATAPKFD